MMARAEYGGCGKSYACKSMERRRRKVLFACPTNRLASNYKEHVCALNKFFGIGLTQGTNMAKVNKTNRCDTIVLGKIVVCS